MNNSVRTRREFEAYQAAERAARQPQGPTAAQIAANEDERRERLAQNMRKIREDQVNLLLLDLTEDEREIVFEIVNRDCPQNLGNPTVLEATLLRVRNEGEYNLREVMQDTTPQEKSEVWQILQSATASDRLGLNEARRCREALQQVRHKHFVED